MLGRPVPERVERIGEGQAERRQRIFDARRNLAIVAALDQPLRLHPAQLPRQRAMGDAGQFALQLVEPLRALEQLVDDHHRPAPRQHAERGLDRTAYGFWGHQLISFGSLRRNSRPIR